MIALADQVVRTTGINWESVSAIAACMALLLVVFGWYIRGRDQHQRDQAQALEQRFSEMQTDFTTAINHLSDVLMAKLETKETVSQISTRLARLEGAAASSADNHVR